MVQYERACQSGGSIRQTKEQLLMVILPIRVSGGSRIGHLPGRPRTQLS
jgi:hypothetical protein